MPTSLKPQQRCERADTTELTGAEMLRHALASKAQALLAELVWRHQLNSDLLRAANGIDSDCTSARWLQGSFRLSGSMAG